MDWRRNGCIIVLWHEVNLRQKGVRKKGKHESSTRPPHLHYVGSSFYSLEKLTIDNDIWPFSHILSWVFFHSRQWLLQVKAQINIKMAHSNNAIITEFIINTCAFSAMECRYDVKKQTIHVGLYFSLIIQRSLLFVFNASKQIVADFSHGTFPHVSVFFTEDFLALHSR